MEKSAKLKTSAPEVNGKPTALRCITLQQALELLEFMESVGYDADTPFVLYANERETAQQSGNKQLTKNPK
jgi:hypothetical protein